MMLHDAPLGPLTSGPWGCFPNRDKAGTGSGWDWPVCSVCSVCSVSVTVDLVDLLAIPQDSIGFPGDLRHLRAQRMKERQGMDSPPLNFPLLVHGGGDDNSDEENSDNDNEHDGYNMM